VIVFSFFGKSGGIEMSPRRFRKFLERKD